MATEIHFIETSTRKASLDLETMKKFKDTLEYQTEMMLDSFEINKS